MCALRYREPGAAHPAVHQRRGARKDRELSAPLHQPKLAGATPAERTYIERWMDWLLASLNTPYVAVFKDAKKSPAERGADFATQRTVSQKALARDRSL